MNKITLKQDNNTLTLCEEMHQCIENLNNLLLEFKKEINTSDFNENLQTIKFVVNLLSLSC